MRLPSPWSCNLLIQPAVLPHQPSTATHTEEDSSLGKASITAPPVEASLGLKATVATATCAPSSALSARGLPPQDGNSSVSLIMSDGPSPRSQWSSKTQQPVPPLSSSSYLPHHRPSVDIEVQGRDTSPLVTRNAYTVVTSDSSIAHVVGSQTTDGDSSHTLLRASDTMPTEFFASSPLLRGMVRSPEVSTNLEGACFEVTGPEVMQPAAAEMLCIPPQLTATNGRRSPQAVIPCTIGAVASAATSAVVKDRTNYIDATVSVKDTMQRGAGSGPYAHPSQVSPPSSESNRPGTSAHNSLQRLHFRKPSLVSHTTNTLPSWTADAASSTGFGSEYSLLQPAAHSTSRCSSSAGAALASPSQAALIPSILSVGDTHHQQPVSFSMQNNGNFGSLRTALSDHESVGSPIHLLERNSTTAFVEDQATATAESRNSGTPCHSLVGGTAAVRKGQTAEMETQVFPGALWGTSPVEQHTPRKYPSDYEEVPRCSFSNPAECTHCAPQKVEVTIDKMLQCFNEDSSAATDNPYDNPYNSLRTPHDLSSVSCASRSLSVSSSGLAKAYAVSLSGEQSASVSGQGGPATTISLSEVQPGEVGRCHTPTSPHTPLTNRTPGPVGFHENSTTQHSLGHSHSRYRSQRLSQSITPQRSARRALSRQTTPSQSFRSKVQSYSFESQQQQCMPNHGMNQMKDNNQLNPCRFLINGELPSAARRDYLAPNRNPFSLYRTLEPYATDLLVHTLSATPGSVSPETLLSERDLSELQTAFAAALQRTSFRPDAAVVLYEQIVPPPLHPPDVLHLAQMDESSAHSPVAAVLLSDSGTEERLSPADPSPSVSGGNFIQGRTWSLLHSQDTATTPPGAAAVSHRCGFRAIPLATQKFNVPSPTRVLHRDPKASAAPILSSLAAAAHLSPSSSFAPPEVTPLTAQSSPFHGAQLTSPSLTAVEVTPCIIPPHGPLAVCASPVSSGVLRDASTGESLLKQCDECSTNDNASPPPQRPPRNLTTVPYSQSSADRNMVSADRQLQVDHPKGNAKAAWCGCDEAHRPFISTCVEELETQKVVHAESPLDLRTGGGCGSTWSSHGSPNCLCRTVAKTSLSASAQPSPVTQLNVFRMTSAPPVQPALGSEVALSACDTEATAAALPLPSLNLTGLGNHSSRLRFSTPTLQRHMPSGREAAELCMSSESSWVPGTRTPVLAGASTSALSSEHIDYRLTVSLSDPLDVKDLSEEEVPGDRFQAHHVFQFLHRVTTTCGRGDVRATKRDDGRRAVPLCVEVNGVTWIATHRLNGVPYAVKEVPAAAFNLAELLCLTLSVHPSSPEESRKREAGVEPMEPHSSALTADDRLEAEDCIARYYSISTPPHNSSSPEVHLLQLEYFPRGSLSELVRRCSGTHKTFSAHKPSSCAVDSGFLSSRFWLEAVTQGLRGLRVLHHADLIHGCPLPLSLFLCGNTPSTVRFKWCCFGNARADADLYPTESLPVWMSEVVARLYERAISGSTDVTPDMMEVAIFSVGILEVLVSYLSAQVPRMQQSRGSQPLRELEWIEVFVMEKSVELYAQKDSDGDMHALVRLMRFLWDVSNSYTTADQVLAQLSVCVDPAARVVEQLYECELARLTRQLEERRRRLHCRTQKRQSQALHGAKPAFPPSTDTLFPRSPAIRPAVADASSRLGEVSERLSPLLHPEHDLAVMGISVSSLGTAAQVLKSRNGSPKLVCSTRPPLHHTQQKHSLPMAGSFSLPFSTAAATATAVAVPSARLRAERTLSDMSGERIAGGMVGHRTRSEVHPRILNAANQMLEKAVRSGEDKAIDELTALLRPAVESMCQRGWTTLYGAVPLAVARDIKADARAGTSEAAEALIRSLRPMTSFE